MVRRTRFIGAPLSIWPRTLLYIFLLFSSQGKKWLIEAWPHPAISLSYTFLMQTNNRYTQVRPQSGTDTTITITVDITNTGRFAGHEVVQLYLAFPSEANEPPKQLKGFQRLYLERNQRKGASFSLSRQDFSIWSVEEDDWKLVEGRYQILIGASSKDIRIQYDFELDSALAVM